MARIERIRIQNYRSVGEITDVTFPTNSPVVLLGQNNAGKSNIVKGLGLVLGAFWTGSHDPEDHEFFGRTRESPIEISIRFDPGHLFGGRYRDVIWRYNDAAQEPVYFRGRPGQYGQPDGFIRNDDRDTCVCVVLEADRNLRYHLGYSSKWTYLSRLMHRFHGSLSEQVDVRNELEALFAQVKAKFGEIPQFADFVAELQAQLNDLVGSMTHRLEVDFEAYNPVNFFHALRLQAAEGDHPRTLDEMGTGEQQILAMAFAYAYAKAFHGGILLVIEEPESHLHPLAQQWLARKISLMTADGLQILLTTHSASFIDVMNLEGLVLVSKSGGSTGTVQITRAQLVERCVAMGVPAGRVNEGNVLPFYAANATKEILEGFFAKVVVLVEGPTESLALPILFQKIGLDVAKEGIAIVPVHGKGNLGKWWRLFRAYGVPCFVIFDNDGSDDGDHAKRRDALIAIGIGADQHATYIGTDQWIMFDDVSVFGSSFEVVLRQTCPGYRELEAQAREQGIDSKPFVARWAAEHLIVDGAQEGWQRLGELAQRVRAKLPSEEAAGQE